MSDAAASPSNPASPLPKFDVTAYRPDGGFAMSGMGMLISALVLLGAALGFVAHWVSQWLYLILIFPCAIGLVLGAVGRRMVKSGRVRNPLLGGLAGFLGGVLAMTMMHYFDYETFKSATAARKPDFIEFAHLPTEDREAAYRSNDVPANERSDIELAVRALNSFPGYMDLQAHEGVQLNKATGGGKGINLGYWGSYVYWIIEVLIVAGITFGMVKGATAEPYCRPCDQWKQPNVLGFFNGDAGAAAQAVAAGDLEALRNTGPTSEVTNVRLTANGCASATPECTVDVKLDHLTADSNGNIKENALAHATYPVQALEHLKSLFQAAAPPETPQGTS
jgi:hypothetical protein